MTALQMKRLNIKAPEFRDLIRSAVQRVCDAHGESREQLADRLGVHRNAIMLAAYRAKIGLDLVERLAREAELSPDELAQLELAWFYARAKPSADRGEDNTFARLKPLLDLLAQYEHFLKTRGILEAFRNETDGGAFVQDLRKRLRAPPKERRPPQAAP
jgi:transcriptional regulator with XRE-family HTH domain